MNRFNQPKILLLGIERSELFGLKEIVHDLKAEVVCVENQDEAQTLLQLYEFAVVIVAIHDSAEAFEAAARIYDLPNTENLPLIFVSDHKHARRWRFRFYRGGEVDFFARPLENGVLMEKVRSYVVMARQKEVARPAAPFTGGGAPVDERRPEWAGQSNSRRSWHAMV